MSVKEKRCLSQPEISEYIAWVLLAWKTIPNVDTIDLCWCIQTSLISHLAERNHELSLKWFSSVVIAYHNICELECFLSQVMMDLTFNEAARGVNKDINISIEDRCERCNGTRKEPGTKTSKCHRCNGTGQVSSDRNCARFWWIFRVFGGQEVRQVNATDVMALRWIQSENMQDLMEEFKGLGNWVFSNLQSGVKKMGHFSSTALSAPLYYDVERKNCVAKDCAHNWAQHCL